MISCPIQLLHKAFSPLHPSHVCQATNLTPNLTYTNIAFAFLQKQLSLPPFYILHKCSVFMGCQQNVETKAAQLINWKGNVGGTNSTSESISWLKRRQPAKQTYPMVHGGTQRVEETSHKQNRTPGCHPNRLF